MSIFDILFMIFFGCIAVAALFIASMGLAFWVYLFIKEYRDKKK